MDPETLHGRVVAERVLRGRRLPQPEVLSAAAHLPDFRLVPREEEESFCQWDKVKDYDPAVDAPTKPKHMEMPPLMKEVQTHCLCLHPVYVELLHRFSLNRTP